MAEHDLTPILGQYLDPHLLIPSLEFLSDKKIYDETDMLKSKLHLISKTNMIDYAIDIHKIIYPDQEEPADLLQKKTNVFKRLERLEKANLPFLNMFSDPEVHEKLEKSRDPRDLIDSLKEHGFKTEMLDHLYEYAKFQYECGKYDKALEYLSILRLFTPQSDKHYLPLFWGMLACHILMSNWDAALEEFNRLKDHIDGSLTPNLMTLQQRTWLIHWGLLIYFNHPQGRDHLVEMFLETNFAKKQNSKQMYYTHALQTLGPHILRYLSVAVIVSKQRRQYMKDLVRIIQSESHAYRDSITEFVECLCVNFDFDAAQGKLRECEEVLNNDFFLVTSLSDFIENARLFIFETFCQIHECISVTKLSEKLNMSEQEAERWIVDLIRNARLDAKIDSKHGHVVMGTQAVSPYQQLIEKTKAMYMRSQMKQSGKEYRTVIIDCKAKSIKAHQNNPQVVQPASNVDSAASAAANPVASGPVAANNPPPGTQSIAQSQHSHPHHRQPVSLAPTNRSISSPAESPIPVPAASQTAPQTSTNQQGQTTQPSPAGGFFDSVANLLTSTLTDLQAPSPQPGQPPQTLPAQTPPRAGKQTGQQHLPSPSDTSSLRSRRSGHSGKR